MSFAAIETRTRERGVPSLAEAVSATGGVAVALGVLLITIDIRADSSGHGAEAALFAGLVVVGYLTVLVMPPVAHAAGISAVVLGIPGALGWLLLPGAHKFGDIRPFIVLTILAWILAFVVPRTGGRTIFIAAAALLLWLWILGEVAGSDAYSAAPIPSPPAHTLFSLQSLTTGRATVDLGDLDSTNPLYGLAQRCSNGDLGSCDTLYFSAPPGSDFQEFAAACGNNGAIRGAGGTRQAGVTNPFSPGSTLNPITPLRGADDKSLDIGLVSAFFGIAYLGALFALDRGGRRGVATAFVVPGFVALLSGTESLGNAAHHAWAGGVLTLVAGIGIGFVGDRTKRRFTTWAGAIAAAFGTVTVALDTAHISRAFGSSNVKLAGPGLLVIVFGAGLVALGVVLAGLLGGPEVPGAVGPPTSGFAPPGAVVGRQPARAAAREPSVAWDPSPWQSPGPGAPPPAGPPPSGDPGPSWPPQT